MENIFILGIPGGSQLIWVVVAILVLFGGKKIPELMRGMGKGIKEFKNASKNEEETEEVTEHKEK